MNWTSVSRGLHYLNANLVGLGFPTSQGPELLRMAHSWLLGSSNSYLHIIPLDGRSPSPLKAPACLAGVQPNTILLHRLSEAQLTDMAQAMIDLAAAGTAAVAPLCDGVAPARGVHVLTKAGPVNLLAAPPAAQLAPDLILWTAGGGCFQVHEMLQSLGAVSLTAPRIKGIGLPFADEASAGTFLMAGYPDPALPRRTAGGLEYSLAVPPGSVFLPDGCTSVPAPAPSLSDPNAMAVLAALRLTGFQGNGMAELARVTAGDNAADLALDDLTRSAGQIIAQTPAYQAPAPAAQAALWDYPPPSRLL
ncbi:hypothetical protein HYH03_009985 [Edaphochlamys debaryana]|uniref:Uncharacterized protein n=1 Tax=Edaphochlamys debaryana TaxID=47281 RepID=A0A835Y5W1_9CHLO|nr:hypothetical protein HYH03_009985 [Edaphochlamys debaryana]|eukprot:KAG2491614.1 hypothetical protein HYH03_009985 [Edaphochlamys debaryana]